LSYCTLQGPELPGEEFLIVFDMERKGKWTWRIRSSREKSPDCFYHEIVRKINLEDPELPGEAFLIVCNKELKWKLTWRSREKNSFVF